MTFEIVEDRDYFKTPVISQTKNMNGIESKMLALPQVDCPVTHSFGPGVYLREVHMPAGALVLGHHHKFEHTNILVKGRLVFSSETGPIELKAPMVIPGKPGRKLAFIQEDTVWINVYANPTNEQDIEKLESLLLDKSENFKLSTKQKNEVLSLTSSHDRSDFKKLVKEFGLTEEAVRSITENTMDLTPLPHGYYKMKVGDSHIEGKGLMATGNFQPGDFIAPARLKGKRTIAGRFTNHSTNPNAKMVRGTNGDINLVATSQISGCLGGQDGQEILINYREALALTLEIAKGEETCRR